MRSHFITAIVSAYLGAGLFAGLLTQRAVPAINPMGIAIITISWPNQIRCARVESACKAMPEWLSPYVFTFKGGDHGE